MPWQRAWSRCCKGGGGPGQQCPHARTWFSALPERLLALPASGWPCGPRELAFPTLLSSEPGRASTTEGRLDAADVPHAHPRRRPHLPRPGPRAVSDRQTLAGAGEVQHRAGDLLPACKEGGAVGAGGSCRPNNIVWSSSDHDVPLQMYPLAASRLFFTRRRTTVRDFPDARVTGTDPANACNARSSANRFRSSPISERPVCRLIRVLVVGVGGGGSAARREGVYPVQCGADRVGPRPRWEGVGVVGGRSGRAGLGW